METAADNLAQDLRSLLKDYVAKNGENIGLGLFVDEVRKIETTVINEVRKEIRTGSLKPGAFF